MTKWLLWIIGLALIGAMLLVRWLGPQWLTLATMDGEHGEGILIIDRLDGDVEFMAGYRALLDEEQGTIVGAFDRVHLWRGSQHADYSHLILTHLPHGRNLLRVLTAPQYRDLNTRTRHTVLVGTKPLDVQPEHEALVVWLFDLRENGRDPLLELMPALDSSEAQLLWLGETLAVDSDSSTDLVVMAGFENTKRALHWLRAEPQRTLHDLMNARVSDLAVLVVTPST